MAGTQARRAASALLPVDIMPDQTVVAAELYAVLFAVQHSQGRIQMWTDCEAVVKGARAGLASMAHSDSALAH
eukprot:2121508-Amphidinium_carterae.1